MLVGSRERLSCFDRTLERGAQAQRPGLAGEVNDADDEGTAIDEFPRCASVANANRRLHCYDQILIPAAALSTGPPEPPAIAASRPAPAVRERNGARLETNAEASAAAAFGLIPENRKLGAVVVRVVATDRNIVDKLVFRTDDGQVWVQTGKAKPRYGSLPFQARIRQASMGSYFLQPVDGGVSVRVKRSQ